MHTRPKIYLFQRSFAYRMPAQWMLAIRNIRFDELRKVPKYPNLLRDIANRLNEIWAKHGRYGNLSLVGAH